MTAGATTLWRVFPWDASAREGRPFSRSFVPDATGRGRFDLPRTASRVLYLAETAEHAVAESLQHWRGASVDWRHLTRAGLPLALVDVRLEASPDGVVDLCDSRTLAGLGISPDRLASRLRDRTQPLARLLWERGHAGLRWWSRFHGDWHAVVAFTGRLAGGPSYGEPVALEPASPPVVDAARALGIELR